MTMHAIALEKFRQGLDFNTVLGYIQGNVRADAPGYNLTQQAYSEYQAELAAKAPTPTPATSTKDVSSSLTDTINKANKSILLPAALFIGGLLIVLGIRSKK